MTLVAPDIFDPLTFHWYWGDAPALTGVAVKVTPVPAQIGLADGVMDMLTGSSGVTVMMIAFDKEGVPVAHAALDVSSQVTASLLTGAKV